MIRGMKKKKRGNFTWTGTTCGQATRSVDLSLGLSGKHRDISPTFQGNDTGDVTCLKVKMSYILFVLSIFS